MELKFDNNNNEEMLFYDDYCRGVYGPEDSLACVYFSRMGEEMHTSVSRINSAKNRDSHKNLFERTKEEFVNLRKRMCLIMHKYIRKHDGYVGKWPYPETGRYFVEEDDVTKYSFNYFSQATDYIQTYSKEPEFINAYEYDKPAPDNDHQKKLEEECESIQKVKAYKEEIDPKYDEALKISEHKPGALLTFVIIILLSGFCIFLWLAPFLSDFDYINLNDNAMKCYSGFTDFWKVITFPSMIITYFGTLLITIGYSLVNFIFEWSVAAYIIACVVLLAAGVVIVLLLWETQNVKLLFKITNIRKLRKNKKQADRELKKAYKEFYSSESYKQAKILDEEEAELYAIKKAEEEDFAEKWQREWFEAVCKWYRAVATIEK